MFVLAEIERLKFIQEPFANFNYKSAPETFEWRGNIQFNPFNLLIQSEIHIRRTLPINFNEYLTHSNKRIILEIIIFSQLWKLGDGASVFQRRALYEARRLRRREKLFTLLKGYELSCMHRFSTTFPAYTSNDSLRLEISPQFYGFYCFSDT